MRTFCPWFVPSPFEEASRHQATTDMRQNPGGCELRCVPFRASQDRLDAFLDILVRRGPVTHADPHCSATFPQGPSTPARAVLLDGGDRSLRLFWASERNQNLIQCHVIEHFVACGG